MIQNKISKAKILNSVIKAEHSLQVRLKVTQSGVKHRWGEQVPKSYWALSGSKYDPTGNLIVSDCFISDMHIVSCWITLLIAS